MNQKLSCALLTAALTLATFVGCSGPAESGGSAPSTPSTPATTPTTTPTDGGSSDNTTNS